MIDLGSGWGTLVTTLARKFPDRQIIGYELSIIPWLFSLLIKQLLHLNNLTLYRKNFLHEDLSGAILLCYLLPENMALLAKKINQDQLPATLLISNTFALPDHKPQETLRIHDVYRSPLYIYKIRSTK